MIKRDIEESQWVKNREPEGDAWQGTPAAPAAPLCYPSSCQMLLRGTLQGHVAGPGIGNRTYSPCLPNFPGTQNWLRAHAGPQMLLAFSWWGELLALCVWLGWIDEAGE